MNLSTSQKKASRHLPPPPAKGTTLGRPDYVGIGAQKSGTTRWYMLLANHPDVFTPDYSSPLPPWYRKERHFFDRFGYTEFEDRHIAQYRQWFPRPSGKVTGEWTPRYMVDPWTPALLARSAPRAKILVLLRDPVARFHSGMLHSERRNRLGPHAAVEHYARGFYAHQLERWFTHFPRNQFLILQFEATTSTPAFWLRETFRFLGLSEFAMSPELLKKRVNASNDAGAYSKPAHLHDALTSGYTPDVLRLRTLVPSLDLTLWPNFKHLA